MAYPGQLWQQPKVAGARTAATVVLHTWGQNLSLHPISIASCPVEYFAPVKMALVAAPKTRQCPFPLPGSAMKKVFRASSCNSSVSHLNKGWYLPAGFPINASTYYRWKEAQLYSKPWVVYTKTVRRIFKGGAIPGKVLHRIAITNHRILDIGQDTVRFAYKDYADGARKGNGTGWYGVFSGGSACISCRRIFEKCGTMAFKRPAKQSIGASPGTLANKKLQLSSRSQRRALAKQRLFARLPINALLPQRANGYHRNAGGK